MIKDKVKNTFFIMNKLHKAGARGRSGVTNLFSTLGIAFGVMALIVILAVMNGFQMGFITTIMEVSSGHVRVSGTYDELLEVRKAGHYKSFFIFSESQALIQGVDRRQHGCLVRAVNVTQLKEDKGFFEQMKIVSGKFDLTETNTVVIGSELARLLGVHVGDTIQLPVIAGNTETDMFPENAILTVEGITKTGFLDVDSSFIFISMETSNSFFGENSDLTAFIKLDNQNNDIRYMNYIKSNFPNVKIETWRTYNHAFFGALRIEKNLIMLLVILIFFVVAVNIYNGMRRAIYEKREDIAVLISLGMKQNTLQFLFIGNGLMIGGLGSIIGLILGLLLSVNINKIFQLAEFVVNYFLVFIGSLIYGSTNYANFYIFNPKYFYIDEISVYIYFNEVLFIFIFGILSASLAALFAARRIIKLRPSEVLRYE